MASLLDGVVDAGDVGRRLVHRPLELEHVAAGQSGDLCLVDD
jgi:hypothetical protein